MREFLGIYIIMMCAAVAIAYLAAQFTVWMGWYP